MGKSVFAARGDIARTLDLDPGPPWRCDALLPRRRPLRTMGSGPLWSGLLRLGRLPLCRPAGACTWPQPCVVAASQPPCPRLGIMGGRPLWGGLLAFGRPPSCRPFGLAHGLDHARLQHLSPLDLDLSPNRWGPFKLAPSVLALGPIGDAMASSRGRSLTRPRMAAGPLQVACFGASVGRVCAGQLALHMASTVRSCGASATSILAQPSWQASSQGTAAHTPMHDSTPPSTPSSSSSSPSSPHPTHTKHNSISMHIVSSSTESTWPAPLRTWA
jgi:hypothetical protein